MDKVNQPNKEIETLEKNWKRLLSSVNDVWVENRNFVLRTVEKDLSKFLDNVNDKVVRVSAELKKRREDMHHVHQVYEHEGLDESEVNRMDDEGGSGFINTLPHEVSPNETSNASTEYHH